VPQNTQYLLTFLGTLVLVTLSTPIFRRLAHRIGMVDHPGGRSDKWHDSPTALLGGVTIIVAVALPLTAGHGARSEVIAIMLGAVLCGTVGLIDDHRALGPAAKVLATVVGAIVLWVAGVQATLTGIHALDFAITVVWIVVATHSMNVVDNMDGVAVGLTVISTAGFFFIAATSSQTRVALLAASLCGACVGFVPFNYRIRGDARASMFLGDSGSLFLGFVLAALALAIDVPGSSVVTRISVPALLLAVPVSNTALVVLSRLRAGRPITEAGADSAAHLLVGAGLSRARATLVFWAAGAGLVVLGIVSTRISPNGAWLVLGAVSTVGVLLLWLADRAGPLERLVVEQAITPQRDERAPVGRA
jgi:UDP-GlcNAc:undecaprenyl-phosphate GlcNAc-1-phosphate transferase